jgi:hypothetical protein
MFTQQHAEAIAKKLKCHMREGRAHRHADVFENGRLIATFGIRRASKEVGHGHLPKDLHLTQKQCRDLHDCTFSREGYIELLHARRLVD